MHLEEIAKLPKFADGGLVADKVLNKQHKQPKVDYSVKRAPQMLAEGGNVFGIPDNKPEVQGPPTREEQNASNITETIKRGGQNPSTYEGQEAVFPAAGREGKPPQALAKKPIVPAYAEAGMVRDATPPSAAEQPAEHSGLRPVREPPQSLVLHAAL